MKTKSKNEYFALVAQEKTWLDHYMLMNQGKNVGNFSGKIAKATFKTRPSDSDIKKVGGKSEDILVKICKRDYDIITENERYMKIIGANYPAYRIPFEMLDTKGMVAFATDKHLDVYFNDEEDGHIISVVTKTNKNRAILITLTHQEYEALVEGSKAKKKLFENFALMCDSTLSHELLDSGCLSLTKEQFDIFLKEKYNSEIEFNNDLGAKQMKMVA